VRAALGRLLAGATLLAACSRDARPNLLLVTLDTTRADRIGAYGDAGARTPTLDLLAARGVLFERAFASTPVTLPSHTSMLTGLGPERHGVLDNGRFVAADSLDSVAERLAAAGYRTAAFVAAFVLDASFGLDQGFQVYDDDIDARDDPLSVSVARRPGEAVTDRALAWLAGSDQPFFAWVHYYDVHDPRHAPPPFDAIEDRYAGALAYVDAQLARLLAGVDAAAGGRETLVVVAGDHGEGLGEHDESSHGTLVYDSTLHIPLLAAGASFASGLRSAAFARAADVAPTLLAAAGLAATGLDGVALQTLAAAGPGGERFAYFQTSIPLYSFGWARLAGVRSERWKYTAEPAPAELYDVLADPGETRNLAAAEPEQAARMEREFRRLAPKEPMANAAPALSVDVAERLADLGYASVAPPPEGTPVPDPRRFAQLPGLVQSARALAQRGHVAASIEALEILAGAPVARPLALMNLGIVLLAADRPDDAVVAFTEFRRRSPTPEAQARLVQALLAAQKFGAAARVASEQPATLAVPDERLLLLRAQALLAAGRSAEAQAVVDDLLRRDASNERAALVASEIRRAGGASAAQEIERSQAWLAAHGDGWRMRGQLARLLAEVGRANQAVRLLESQPSIPPEHLRVLAEIARQHGNPQKAAERYQALLALRPGDFAARRELAFLAGDLGRFEQALDLYAELIAADPGDATLRVERGATYVQMRRAGEAEAEFRRAAELDPELPEAHFNLGVLLSQTGRAEEAIRELGAATELEPGYARAHLELARLYRRRGDLEAANRQAAQAVEAQ